MGCLTLSVNKSYRRELHKGKRAPAKRKGTTTTRWQAEEEAWFRPAQKVCTGASTATRCRKTHRLRVGCSAQSVASGTTRNVAMTNLYVTLVCD